MDTIASMTASEWALAATQLAMGFALAASAGLRAFLPIFVVGLLARQGYLELGASFEWMAGTPALTIFGSAVVFEILGDKFPAVDHALDAVGTIVKPVAGTLVAAALLTDLDPVIATALGLVAGGTTAAAVHLLKAKTRLASTVITAGFANPVLSFAEDGFAFFGIALAILVPVLAALAAIGLLALGVAIYRRQRRRRQAAPSAPVPG
jgi:hypothetical protein